MQKIEVVVRITKDHCPPQEQTIFEWFDLMRNPTDALSRPDLEINLEHHRVFKHGTEVYDEEWCDYDKEEGEGGSGHRISRACCRARSEQ